MTRFRSQVSTGLGAALFACVLALSGCAGDVHKIAIPGPTAPSSPSVPALPLPPVHGRFSYQIGGPYSPASGVQIVDRDRSARPAAGVYSICYVNAFQAQTEDVPWWNQHYPALLLRDSSGTPIIDKDWNEPLFDTSTAVKRAALLRVIGPWIDGCARSGFRAVEPDNLDSYTRSKGLLNATDALSFSALLTARAHHDHLAIAEKNAAELAPRARRAGFDFAITEECQVYNECGAYTSVYGSHVIEIEYTDNPSSVFTTACQQRGKTISVVLRDRDVTPSGDSHHIEQWCSAKA